MYPVADPTRSDPILLWCDLSHALTEASSALDNSLEEEGAEEGPLLVSLARFKDALDQGAADLMELNAGVGRGGFKDQIRKGA